MRLLHIFCFNSIFLFLCAIVYGKPNPVLVEQHIQDRIQFAQQLFKKGELEESLSILEELNQEHSTHLDITEALAYQYFTHKNYGLAASCYEQVYKLCPDNTIALLFAAQSQVELGNYDAAANYYSIYLQHNAQDQLIWKNLALAKIQTQDHKAALNAYLKAFNLDRSKITGGDHLKIAQLHLDLNNTYKAQEFYTYALKTDTTRQEALLGLIQVDVDKLNWKGAKAKLAMLDSLDPQSIEKYSAQHLRSQIDLYGEKPLVAKGEGHALSLIDKEFLLSSSGTKESIENVPLSNEQEHLDKDESSASISVQTVGINPKIGKKRVALAQLTAPKIKLSDEKPLALADAFPFYKKEEISSNMTLSQCDISLSEEKEDAAILNESLVLAKEEALSYQNDTEVMVFQDIINQAQQLQLDGQYTQAIQSYWKAIGLEGNNSEVWSKIANAYLHENQLQEAEMAALEAIKNTPNSIAYMFQYLKIIERSQSTNRFIQELHKARVLFPKVPELTLALARAYEHYQDNSENAIQFYTEFLKQAGTEHVKRQEAKDALQRLL